MYLLDDGLKVTVTGMLIVFLILFILYIVMTVMRKVFYKEKILPAAGQNEEVIQGKEAGSDTDDSDEIIAVITAAIACSLKQPSYNLKVKSFRRVDQSRMIWNQVGRKEQMESRMIIK